MKKKREKKSVKTVSKLKKELWALYSKYRRLSENVNGMNTCYTCGVVKPYKEMQLGHYIPRSHTTTFIMDENNHVQCPACNLFKGGNLTAYAVHLEQDYGVGILQRLEELKHTTKQFKTFELEELIEKYKNELKRLEGSEEGIYRPF